MTSTSDGVFGATFWYLTGSEPPAHIKVSERLEPDGDDDLSPEQLALFTPLFTQIAEDLSWDLEDDEPVSVALARAMGSNRLHVHSLQDTRSGMRYTAFYFFPGDNIHGYIIDDSTRQVVAAIHETGIIYEQDDRHFPWPSLG